MRRKRERASGPEIIPHPDDIDIDPRTGAVSFNGPLTLDQKMAQDLVVSAWPGVGRELRNSPLFQAKDPWSTSIREVQKKFRNHRTPGGEAGVQDQFVGFGDVGGGNGPSAKVPLANDMREI
jgi:hypothetical protein